MADRTKLDEYIAELEAAAYARGREDARAEMKAELMAFQKGLQANVEKLSAELERAKERLTVDLTEKLLPYLRSTGTTVDAESEPREPREGSDQAKVLEVIREHPGLRGMEVVKALNGSVEERTVRTALHRLKRRNAIMQREGAWHPVSMSLFQNSESQSPV